MPGLPEDGSAEAGYRYELGRLRRYLSDKFRVPDGLPKVGPVASQPKFSVS